MQAAATSNAIPSHSFRRFPASSPSARSTSTPQNAAGTEPSISQRKSSLRTVPRRMCTLAPTGFITSDTTRSLDTAASGSMWNRSTSIGVISAPPPMPVSPTTKPPTNPANVRSSCKMVPLRTAASRQ